MDVQWHSWKEVHGKIYADQNEESARRHIWLKNLARIQEHNTNGGVGGAPANFSLAINQFADLVRIN